MYLMSAIAWSLDLGLLWRELYRLLLGNLPDLTTTTIPAAIQTFDAKLLVAQTVCTYINVRLHSHGGFSFASADHCFHSSYCATSSFSGALMSSTNALAGFS